MNKPIKCQFYLNEIDSNKQIYFSSTLKGPSHVTKVCDKVISAKMRFMYSQIIFLICMNAVECSTVDMYFAYR